MTIQPAYHRAATPTAIATGEGRAIDALYNMLYSFGAIVYMMRALLNEDEGHKHIAEHVWHLLDQQHSMLAGVYEELGREEAERGGQAPPVALSEAAQKLRLDLIEAGAKAGADPASIAAAMNIPSTDIEDVVSRLRGEKPRAGRVARV